MERWHSDAPIDLGAPFAIQHDQLLVVASVLIASLAASVLLPAVERFRASRTPLSHVLWTLTGAVAMAMGFWGMHFTNLLALQLPVAIGYTFSIAALSAVPIVAGAALTIAVCKARIQPLLRVAIAAAGLTLAFAGMHSISMKALVAPLEVSYNLPTAIVMVATAAALFWLAIYGNVYLVIRTRNHWSARVIGSLLLGGSATAAHFGAMFSTHFYPNPALDVAVNDINARSLGLGIGVVIALLVGLLLTAIMLDRRMSRISRSLNVSESRFRILAETSACAIFTCGDNFTYANPALSAITGYSQHELLRMPMESLFGPALEDRLQQLQNEARPNQPVEIAQEVEIQRRDGEIRWAYVTIGSTPGSQDASYVGSAFDITERKQMEKRLRHLAFYDSLTDLCNRVYFLENLQKRLSGRHLQPEGDQCAVLAVNLSRLKWINDSFGQAAGDDLLRDLSRELSKLLGPGDSLARVGGHEFAILLTSTATVETAKSTANAVIQLFALPYSISEQEIHLRCQVGVALATAAVKDAEELLRQAYIAMNQARNLNGNVYCLFDQAMREDTQKRLQLESDLNRALAEQHFELYYQPIVSLPDGARIRGFEALIRWPRPDGSFTPPVEFIPVAEETGLIARLGDWILQEACRQIEYWNNRLGVPVYVSVNISSLQLFQPNFVSNLGQLIARHNVAPGQLKLELTESVLVEDGPGVLRTMKDLLALGCEIMIDDFGTGYSSLSYLSRFPASVLKIDKAFIQGLGSASGATGTESGESAESSGAPIIKAIVSLARDLNLSVVAEGIEHAHAAETLHKMGCKSAQGYFFSHPLPHARATALLQKSAHSKTFAANG